MTSVLLEQPPETEFETSPGIAPWTAVHGWFALLPMVFIAVGGWIQTESAPVAFRFTAMAQDSFAPRMTRVGCSILIVLLISMRLRETLSVCKKHLLLLLLPALAFVSAFWSQNPTHTLVDAVNLTLITLFAVYLYVRYPGERLIAFLSFAAAISLLMCVFAVVFMPGVGIDPYQEDAWRGVFGQRNNCAIICVCFLVVALHYRARALDRQIVRWTVLILASLFIVMSGSRTGWALTAFAVALTVSIRLVQRTRTLDRIVVLMAIAVPVTALAMAVASNFTQTLALMDRDPTMTQRTVIWAEVLPSIAKRPLLGYGYAAFWNGLNGESTQTVLVTGWMEGQAQDGYLDLLLQLGLIGAVPLVWMFVRGAAQAWTSVQAPVGLRHAQMATVLLPLVLVENIGESSFLLPLAIPWFFTLLSLLVLARAAKRTEAA